MKNSGKEGTKKLIDLLINKGQREEAEKEIGLTYLDDMYLEKIRKVFLNKGWSAKIIEGLLKDRLLWKELSDKKPLILTELEAALETCVEDNRLDSAREMAGLINLLLPK